MELLALILTITSVHSLPESACDRIMIGDHYYEKEILWADIGRPYNLNVHRFTNTLFFSYSTSYSDTDFQLGSYTIDTKRYNNIAGIVGGCTTAIDNDHGDIYMGGSDGIYKYNMMTNIADFYNEKGKNIWALFHRKNLFYISYPEQKLFLEVDGKFAIVEEFQEFEIDHFHITNKGEIYFANKTGLYKFNNKSKFVDIISELISVRQIVEDSNESVYIVTNFGIYLIGVIEELQKVLELKNILSLAFDKDNNFIISNEKSIIRLNLSKHNCKKNAHW